MTSARVVLAIAVATMGLIAPRSAAAQPDSQLWGQLALRWIESDFFTYGLDIEPQVLVSAPSGDPGWVTLDVTPNIEYSGSRWVDLVGELRLSRTRQTDDLDSTEVAPRVGFRFHLLSNLHNLIDKERQPRRRVVVTNLLRFEWRNFFYSNGQPEESTERLRDRVDVSFTLNRPRITDAGARYVESSIEWFWPRGNPDERFANQQRIRAGFGYRRNRAWRFEALYIWDRSRDSANEGFSAAYHAVEVKARRTW